MMTKPTSTTRIDHLIEEQVLKWQKASDRRKKKSEPPPPVITISRQSGNESAALISKISEELKLDIFDNQIIHEVSQSVKMSDRVVESLDGKTRSTLDNWIQFLKANRYIFPDTYLTHLTKVIGTIGEQGGAIILGRGANHILPPEETLRLRLIAPLGHRIQNVAKNESISIEAAERQITKKESEQRAFIKKYFEVDIEDPIYYDLIINTQFLSSEKIVNLIKASVKYKKLPARRRFDKKPEGE
ncbi:MAG: cytidylate kinase-like family protein [Syntrophales bacterium]|jgi:cytidylate kinase|nr:cytidylate kinase-like family protein [Syntrophales bacterium]